MKKLALWMVLMLMLLNLGGAALAEPVVITVKVANGYDDIYGPMFDVFNEAHDDIQVVMQNRADTTDTEHNAIVTMLAAGSHETDIMYIDTSWLQELASAGWLLPLDDYLPEDYNDDFAPVCETLTVYEGAQYAVMHGIDLSAIFYRTDLFEAAGLTPPTTWDELMEAGKQLTQDDTWGYVWQGMQYEGLVCDWIELLHSFGGAIFDNYEALPGQREVTINSPEAVRATQYLYDLICDAKISPEGVLSYNEGASSDVFLAGNAAMLRNWGTTPAALNKSETVKDVWGMVQLPSGENGSRTCAGGWCYAVNAFTPDREAAVTVLQWLSSYDYMLDNLLLRNVQPPRQSVYEAEEVVGNEMLSYVCGILKEAAATGMARPLSVVWNEESDVIQRALHAVFAGNQTAEAAMAWAADEIALIEDSFVAR